MKKFSIWVHNNRGLSPIFATVLLATIIIVFGSVAYYYANNLTTSATNNYVKTLSDSQQSMAERIGFENVVYDNQSSPATLAIYIINCGSANNVKINSVFLYDASHNIKGVYSSSTSFPLKTIDRGIPIDSLNAGKEGYFTVTLLPDPSLISGSMYTIHLVTQSGSAFDYDFVMS
jgi:hypothetical protein